DANIIEAFDQDWKYQSEGTVGANWGLWTAHRQEKFPLTGPVVENPAWPRDAALGCMLGVALLIAAFAGPPLHGAAQAKLAVLAMASGGVLSFAIAGTLAEIFDAYSALAAVGDLLAQSLLALLLTRRVRALLTGSAIPPP